MLESLLFCFWWLFLSSVAYFYLEQAWHFKAITEQFESLESFLLYQVEICLPTITPTEYGCACWNFRKINLLLCLHVIPSSACRNLPCLFKAILSGTRWWDTCFVMLLKVVEKRQHGGGETHKDSACVFLHSGLLRVASAPRAHFPMVVIRCTRNKEVGYNERTVKWDNLPS